MSLQDITSKITEDAQAQVGTIEERAKKELVRVEDEALHEREAMIDAFNKETAYLLENNEVRLRSSAEQEAKMLSEKAKREALDSVFVDALKTVRKLPHAEYMNLLGAIVKKMLPHNSSGTVLCAKGTLKATERALASVHFDGIITEKDSVPSGFIITTPDSEYNFTFEKILADKRDQLEIDIANILFG